MYIYRSCVEKFGWSIRDIDETDLDTLFEFMVLKNKPDPNTRVIDGEIYTRSAKTPTWL
jgi:hypothetical protein